MGLRTWSTTLTEQACLYTRKSSRQNVQGRQNEGSDTFCRTEAPPSKIDIPSGPQRKTRARGPSHPRYNLFVYGCTSDVFNVISSTENDTYALILQSRDFLAEHPRADSDSLAVVQRLKESEAILEHW